MNEWIEKLNTEGRGSFNCPSCGSDAGDGYAEYPYCPKGCTEAQMVQVMGLDQQVPECPEAGRYGHDARSCLACTRRHRHVARMAELAEENEHTAESMRVNGAFLFELPRVAPLWGTEESLLAAEGQGWMIVGPDGTGKTSTAAQYVKARLGLEGWAGSMWGLPVKPLPADQSVYYMAMDRPRQMMEAFMRGVGEEHRDEMARRMFVHRGPPPLRLSRENGQRWLLREVEETNAGMVVLDSRKDLGSTVDPIEVAGVARAVQLLVAAGVEVLVLAHPVKGRRNGPPSLEDVSGLRDVFSGLGSVVFLDGDAGKRVVDVFQVKPIRELVPPFRIRHDHAAGRSDRTDEVVEVTDDRKPTRADRVREVVLNAIDGHKSGWARADSIQDCLTAAGLGTVNLSRDLKPLKDAGLIEPNGKRGSHSAYRRGQVSQ